MDQTIDRTYHSLSSAALSVCVVAVTVSLKERAQQAPIFLGVLLLSLLTVQVSVALNNINATTATIWAVSLTGIIVVLASPRLKNVPYALPIIPALVLASAAGVSYAKKDSSSSLTVAVATTLAAVAWAMAFGQISFKKSSDPTNVAKVTPATKKMNTGVLF